MSLKFIFWNSCLKIEFKLCPLECIPFLSWPSDRLFDPAFTSDMIHFYLVLDYMKINIWKKKFHKDGIKTVLCNVYTCFFFKDLTQHDAFQIWPRFYEGPHSDKISQELDQNCALYMVHNVFSISDQVT